MFTENQSSHSGFCLVEKQNQAKTSSISITETVKTSHY